MCRKHVLLDFENCDIIIILFSLNFKPDKRHPSPLVLPPPPKNNKSPESRIWESPLWSPSPLFLLFFSCICSTFVSTREYTIRERTLMLWNFHELHYNKTTSFSHSVQPSFSPPFIPCNTHKAVTKKEPFVRSKRALRWSCSVGLGTQKGVGGGGG